MARSRSIQKKPPASMSCGVKQLTRTAIHSFSSLGARLAPAKTAQNKSKASRLTRRTELQPERRINLHCSCSDSRPSSAIKYSSLAAPRSALDFQTSARLRNPSKSLSKLRTRSRRKASCEESSNDGRKGLPDEVSTGSAPEGTYSSRKKEGTQTFSQG